LAILGKMLGLEGRASPFGVRDGVDLRAASTGEYLWKLSEFVAGVENKFLRVETQLEAKGLVTADEIERGDATPTLLLSMWDQRPDMGRTFDLPEVSFRNASVQWTTPSRLF
jgi:hypothetical protein